MVEEFFFYWEVNYMAKNLVATPWRWRAADPGFGYAGGFQDILTAYNGLNHRGADKRYQLGYHSIVYLK